MSFDLARLLAPLPGGSGTGDNLEYDPAFASLERALAGKPEQQIGSTIVPAQPPEWAQVESAATELLGRTRDVRLAVALACARTARYGFQGFSEGTALIRGLCEQFWASVHPELDADDPTDATMRVSALAALSEPRVLALLRGAPLLRSRSFGVLTWRGLQGGEAGAAPLEPSSVDGAFTEVGQDELRALVAALRDSASNLAAIEAAFAGVSRGPEFAPLLQLLREVVTAVSTRLQEDAPASALDATATGGGAVPARRTAGELASRDDVLRAIDAICKYYATYEPSSPLPLLLARCKRLVPMSFMDIVKEMMPDALGQVQLIAGKPEA